MKYVVIECNLTYAVVMDESGNFIRVANVGYKVGDTPTEIVKMKFDNNIDKQYLDTYNCGDSEIDDTDDHWVI